MNARGISNESEGVEDEWEEEKDNSILPWCETCHLASDGQDARSVKSVGNNAVEETHGGVKQSGVYKTQHGESGVSAAGSPVFKPRCRVMSGQEVKDKGSGRG